jgi:hypothetical protein
MWDPARKMKLENPNGTRTRRRRQPRGWHEHFLGGLRLNCESVPRLPAGAIRWVLDDPRKIPYLFLWRLGDRPVSGVPENVETVRVAALPGGPPPVRPAEEWVSVRRPTPGLDVACVHALQVLRRRLPYDGEDVFLLCPSCEKPRRYLYAWQVIESRLVSRPWHCRNCAGLRYQSEGTCIPREWRALGGYPRAKLGNPTFSHRSPILDR